MSRVLVVERHDGLRYAICKLLTGMGINVMWVRTVKEMSMVNCWFDMIISDNGSAKYLEDYKVPILVLAPSAKEDTEQITYFNQPFEVNDFKAKVESVLLQTHV